MFLKTGILSQLEAMKDERLSEVLTLLQARIWGKMMRIKFQRILVERYDIPSLHLHCWGIGQYDLITL